MLCCSSDHGNEKVEQMRTMMKELQQREDKLRMQQEEFAAELEKQKKEAAAELEKQKQQAAEELQQRLLAFAEKEEALQRMLAESSAKQEKISFGTHPPVSLCRIDLPSNLTHFHTAHAPMSDLKSEGFYLLRCM